jgi:hypothetical protein
MKGNQQDKTFPYGKFLFDFDTSTSSRYSLA